MDTVCGSSWDGGTSVVMSKGDDEQVCLCSCVLLFVFMHVRSYKVIMFIIHLQKIRISDW